MNKHLPLSVSSPFALIIFALLMLSTSTAHAVKPQDYNLKEGDLISAVFSDDPDVYIINDYGYKRLFLNPEIFKFYSHLGGFASVKIVTPEIRDAFVTSGLFRDCENNDQKVYGIQTTGEDVATLNWVNTPGAQAVTDDPDFFKKVFCINNKEFSWYPRGSEFRSVREVPNYSRRRGTPTPTPVFTATPTPYLTPVPTPIGSLSFSQSAFGFSYTQGGNLPANQRLTFTNTSSTPINYSISVNNQPAWLNTGYATSQLTAYPNQPVGLGAAINPTGLNPGTYTTTITIIGGFAGSPFNIPVTLTVVAAPSPTPTPTLSITISNTTDWLRNPTFLAGDYYHILTVTNTSNKTLKSCYTFNGSSGCDTGNYSTNFYGTWNLDSQVLGISVGTWSRWVEIDGIKSNIVNYSVVNAPQLYIYNLTDPSRNPIFSSGDGLRLAASGPANKNLKSCYTLSRNGSLVSTGCDPEGSFFSFNATGTWNVDTQVVGISAGNWTRWVEVDGIKSDIVNYTVNQ